MKDILLIMENVEEFYVPKKYVKKIKISKGRIKSLLIHKSYLNVINKYCSLSDLYDTIEHIRDRFLFNNDITNIEYNDKYYMVNYIEDMDCALATNNVLQTIKYTKNCIKINWDIDERNTLDSNYTLHIHRKYYRNVYDYKTIKTFR